MNCIWTSKTEVNISLDKQFCRQLSERLKQKEKYAVSEIPQGKIRIDLDHVSTSDCFKAFKEVKLLGLLIDPTVSLKEISFVKTLIVHSLPGNQPGKAEQIAGHDGLTLIVSPRDLRQFYLGLKHFCEGYWWFSIGFESLRLAVSFASHGDEHNDLDKLEDGYMDFDHIC